MYFILQARLNWIKFSKKISNVEQPFCRLAVVMQMIHITCQSGRTNISFGKLVSLEDKYEVI